MTSVCFDDFGSDFNAGAPVFSWLTASSRTAKNSNFIVEQVNPAWKVKVQAKLAELSRLQPGWDSYGAREPQVEYLNAAMTLLSEVMLEDTPVPWIVPTPDGRVQIEWHEQDIDLEIELVDSSSFSIGFEDFSKGLDEEFLVFSDLTKLASVLQTLTSRALQD